MPKMLAISITGPHLAHRFVIIDMDGNYWCGKDTQWTRDHRKAGLFATPADAGEKVRELMLSEVPGPLITFTTEIVIEVKSPTPVSAKEVSEWLNKSVKMYVDARCGIGPVADSMAMLRVDWDNLKPLETADE
jgi:hypothetical protein